VQVVQAQQILVRQVQAVLILLFLPLQLHQQAAVVVGLGHLLMESLVVQAAERGTQQEVLEQEHLGKEKTAVQVQVQAVVVVAAAVVGQA
jgi:hypothetical protein